MAPGAPDDLSRAADAAARGQVRLHSPEETRTAGRLLGSLLLPGDVVTLSGELGAGKTTFAQGVAAGLGVTEPVTSPTFALMQEYVGRALLRHLDLYRLHNPSRLEELGWEELFSGDAVVLIEWPERAAGSLPPAHLGLELHFGAAENERSLAVTPYGTRATGLAATWLAALTCSR